jgi:hypothetical protein
VPEEVIFTYRVYGLTISCFFPLDGIPASGEPDVVIRRASLAHVGEPLRPEAGGTFAGGTAMRLTVRWPDLLAAEIRDGREVLVDAAPGWDEDTLAMYVLGQGLALILQQRGLLVLHASCVDLGGRAVAIAGYSGAGKSTTAAALVRHGHALLCDDVTPVRPDHSVVPGVDRLKLWPGAAAALGLEVESLSSLGSQTEKRGCRPNRAVPLNAVPLHRMYILADGPMRAQTLPPVEATRELVRHSCGLNAIHYVGKGAEHFLQVTAVTRAVSVRRLIRPRDLGNLDALARFIIRDMENDA